MSFFSTKTIDQLQAESDQSNLSKNLGALDLTFLGVGGIIGAGIFVLTGIAAAKYAGPALSISFVIAGTLCILVGLHLAVYIHTPLPHSVKAWPSSPAGPSCWLIP